MVNGYSIKNISNYEKTPCDIEWGHLHVHMAIVYANKWNQMKLKIFTELSKQYQ